MSKHSNDHANITEIETFFTLNKPAFRYFYTDNGTDDFEIQEVLAHVPVSFIGVPVDRKNLGSAFHFMMNLTDNYACFFGVHQEKDLEHISKAYLTDTLTREVWKRLGAKRFFLKNKGFESESAGVPFFYDWPIRTWLRQT